MRFTQAELQRFRDRTVPDLLPDPVRLLFIGINPSLWTAATGAHFARPGNRFYPALHRAGLISHAFDASAGYAPEDLAGRIGLVPQRPFLFSGTVASNLRFGREDATDGELWEALRVAQAEVTMSSRSRRAVQPRRSRMRVTSATTAAGSPARRSPSTGSTGRPATRAMAARTSRGARTSGSIACRPRRLPS